MHDLSYEHLIIPYILRVLQHMILPRFSLLLFPPLVEVVFCWKHLESLILKPKGRTAKGGSSADGGSRSGLGLHLKLRLKCDGAVYKQPRTHVCFTQSDDAPQPFRSLSRFCPFSAFVSVLFRSGLSFIVLLQSCLRRFMLGQSCALVISLLPHCFFPFFKTGGSVAADSNFLYSMLAI